MWGFGGASRGNRSLGGRSDPGSSDSGSIPAILPSMKQNIKEAEEKDKGDMKANNAMQPMIGHLGSHIMNKNLHILFNFSFSLPLEAGIPLNNCRQNYQAFSNHEQWPLTSDNYVTDIVASLYRTQGGTGTSSKLSTKSQGFLLPLLSPYSFDVVLNGGIEWVGARLELDRLIHC
ncbi:hypothetical protein Taro_036217, partial [Colocasia esculenta]|nr:hypothetical protein [Colocasia esculenta]